MSSCHTYTLFKIQTGFVCQVVGIDVSLLRARTLNTSATEQASCAQEKLEKKIHTFFTRQFFQALFNY